MSDRAQRDTEWVVAGDLDIAYQQFGSGSRAVVLLHGFPYDVHAFDEVAPRLAAAGCRALVPYLRGFGPTRFRSAATPRSGQQGALAHDLLAFLDALGLDTPILAGYDWGGRAACIAAALWPERVAGLVTVNGYNIQDIPGAASPRPPEEEHRLWYQYYFHGERGRAGLERNRRDLCRLLWRLWSPNWRFEEATYRRSAASFENPDFVEVVIHSYRHRFALVAGDPRFDDLERRLAAQPPIRVPTVSMDGSGDGVMPIGGCAHHAPKFTGPYRHQVVPEVGHDLPQEAPEAFAEAVLSLR